MKCKNCKYWTKIVNSEHYKNMGSCSKLSAIKGEDYPKLSVTGIESTPICIHDGIGTDYETKAWFGCIHFNAL